MATPSPATPYQNGSERRRLPRYNMALDIAFGPLAAKADATKKLSEHSFTVNLSVGGICVYSNILHPIGTVLRCLITLPIHPEPLAVTGVVAWFQRLERDIHQYKLGIEFHDLAPESLAAFQQLFERPAAVATSRAKTLLLVDDDPELQLALKLRFESVGFRIITANEGLEALRKAREQRPDLIILDLMLPTMNGYEVCRLLKFDQKFGHIPVLLMTARSKQEDMEMGHRVGADGYLTKPFDGKMLIEKVEKLLGLQHSS